MKLLKEKVIALLCLGAALTGGPLSAEVWFGKTNRSWDNPHNLAPQGRFFATSDYGFTLGSPDPFLKSAWGYKRFTRGQITATQPAGTLRHLLPESEPWISGPGETLFGVAFEKPFVSDDKPLKDPVLFDHILLSWGSEVPEPGSWGGVIVTKEGEIKRLAIDPAEKLYPYDKTELRFDPVTIDKLYFAKTPGKSGNNLLELNGLRAYFAERPLLTNRLAVWQPDFYGCTFDSNYPGAIVKIFPMCEFFTGVPSFEVTTTWFHSPGILSNLQPGLIHRGKFIQPMRKDYEVRSASANGVETLRYFLEFAVPGRDEPVKLDVGATFRRNADDSITLDFTSVGDLPPETAIAVSVRGSKELFTSAVGKKVPGTFDPAQAIKLDTPAGEVSLAFSGARLFNVSQDSNDYRSETKDLSIWELKDFKQQRDYVFQAESAGNHLSLTIGLPLFEKAKPLPQKFAFYDAPADSGAKGTAPFRAEDLELVDTIQCGDPKDPHAVYDITNDPNLKYERTQNILSHVRAYNMDTPPLIERPEAGAVPITNVAGQACRAIPAEYGAYVRYVLNADLEVGAYYLVEMEHAFDRTRRGSLEITSGQNFNFLTRSGLDTGTLSHDGKFQKESILFKAQQSFRPVPSHEIAKPFSLWIANAVMWQGWIKGPGPAIKSINIYKVKNMPRIPDLAKLLPDDPGQRRHVGYHTQYFLPEFFRVDNQLTGMDQVWSNISVASVLASGMLSPPLYPDAGLFHPGTLDAYAKALELAEKNGNTVKTYLAYLLHWGSPGTRDSFGGFTESGYASYNWDNIPISPTKDEREIISQALARSLPELIRYKSLQVVCMADTPGAPFTRRNLADFSRDTGHKVDATAIVDRDVLNAAAILDAGPETVQAWIKWSGEKRHALLTWLRDEIRKQRPDLTLMVNTNWTRGLTHPYWNESANFPLAKENLERHGLKTYGDYLKMNAYNPALYKGEKGIAMQIHAGWPAVSLMGNNHRSIEVLHGKSNSLNKTGEQGPAAPDFSDEPWMRDLAASFEGGLNYSLSISSEESPKPWTGHMAHCFKNGTELQKSMIQAAVLNARFVDMETYAFAWSGRIPEIRRFAVPFRLLPFTTPEPFEGKLRCASDTLMIRKHGNRYALINSADTPQKAVIEIPDGTEKLTDLSSGFAVKYEIKEEDGKRIAEWDMEPYSLKVLSFDE